MRCGIFTSWNVDSRGRCKRVFCRCDGQKGCGKVKYREGLLERAKSVRTDRLKLEAELIA